MRRVSILCVALFVILTVAMAFAPVAYAAGAESYATDPYSAFQKICNDYADRTVGKNGATQIANWLAIQLQSLGYVASGDSMVETFRFTASLSDSLYNDATEEITACNVVAYKRSGKENAPLLVIGAPFDNERNLLYGGAALSYDEALANASSAATLLSIAASIRNSNFSFDVAICFWGASFFDYQGTQSFLESNKQPLLGYIDLYNVAGGDYVNVYYDETDRTHGAFVDAFLARYQYLDVHHKPFDPGYTSAVVSPYPYGHAGMGANAVMMAQSVPSIRLFGYNWEERCESVRFDDVVFSEDDTLEKAVTNYGDKALSERMLYVKEIVRNLVMQDIDLQSALSTAAQDKTALSLVSSAAQKAFTYSIVGIVALAVLLAALLLLRRSKQAGVPDFSVNSEFINGESKTDDKDDVFGADNNSIEGNRADIDNDASAKDDFDDIFGEH